jgi:formylglycine-generating enzyme required for sulfatase activity
MPFHAIGLHIQDCDSDSSVGDIVIDNVFLAEDGKYFLTESSEFLEQNLIQFSPVPTGSRYTVIGADGMTLLRVPSGSYTQGSPSSDTDRSNNEIYRDVTISKDFYLGQYEVTQAQYEAVMTGNNLGLSATPSSTTIGDDKPVTHVKRTDVDSFLGILNSIEQTAGRLPNGWVYDLPTEAEWEYVMRFMDGSTYYKYINSVSSNDGSVYTGGANVNGTAIEDSGSSTDDNAAFTYGTPTITQDFYDMVGNVSEWVKDKYVRNLSGDPVTDPYEAVPSSLQNPDMYKGGNYKDSSVYARTANRTRTSIGIKTNYIGFRLALRQT